jgi:hypothetical protein
VFSVCDVSKWLAERPETLGSKEKFWVASIQGEVTQLYLFKVGRPNTGENWSEKVACEISNILHVPSASYEFANHNGRLGVISKKFFLRGSFHPANTLLPMTDSGYETGLRYKQTRYRLLTSLATIRAMKLHPPEGALMGLPK